MTNANEGKELVARSRKRIAVITDTLFEAYQNELRKAFERAAQRDGFDLIIVIGRALGHADAAERAQNAVYDWLTPESVDGVVLLSSTLINFQGLDPLRALIQRLGPLPKVSVGTDLQRVASITVDNRVGMRDAVDHLIEVHGCRRIAYLAGPSDNQEAKARLEGYRYALEAHFLPFDQSLVEPCAFTVDGGATAMRRVLERTRDFAAVIAANDAAAVGAEQVLRARGLHVPAQVKLMGFDDSPLAVCSLLSSVAQPFNQLAVHAIEALRGAMQGRPPSNVAFRPRLAVRNSCGCGDTDTRGELPVFERGQSVVDYLATHRAALAECLLEINAACFDWWSTRAERLLAGLESGVGGHEHEFLLTLDALVAEAVDDGVPVDQIGRCITRLQRHFDDAGERVSLHHIWSRALARLVATFGNRERHRRVEGSLRLSNARDFAAGLWDVQDERRLVERLAAELPGMGVRRAYLGLFAGADKQRLRPCLQLEGAGSVQIEGLSYPVGQLLPPEFPAADSASTLLVSAVNFGPDVAGVWMVDGSTDVFVFEQVRTHVGAALERLRSPQILEIQPSSVPLPRPMDETLRPQLKAGLPTVRAGIAPRVASDAVTLPPGVRGAPHVRKDA